MLRYSIFLLIAIFTAIISFSCGDSISSPKEIVFPDKNISYTSHVEPFLNLTCAFSGCHGFSAAGGIMLNDYFSIINSPGLVIAGNPDGSLLMQILEERKPHFTYYEKSNITENHVKGMRQWIIEGANLNHN
jgi:hypothetical protein